LEDLQEQEEEARDNIPESLQDTEKYERADEACSNLEDAVSGLEDVIDSITEAIDG
jgi:hypothetical protein